MNCTGHIDMTMQGEMVIHMAPPANQLPGSFHADRLLVAIARHHDLRLITEDRNILDYARQGYLCAHATDDKELFES